MYTEPVRKSPVLLHHRKKKQVEEGLVHETNLCDTCVYRQSLETMSSLLFAYNNTQNHSAA